MQTDFTADRDIIDRAIQNQLMAMADVASLGRRNKRRDMRRAYLLNRDRAWQSARRDFKLRHGGEYGIMSILAWWEVIALFWKVFVLAWEKAYGPGD